MAKLSILPLIGMAALAWGEHSTRADPPPPGPADVSNHAEARSADAILAAAVRRLETQNSVSAKISQEINLFDNDLRGSGLYIEQQVGSVRLMRLELKTQLGDERSVLVQVCDGRFLWTYKKCFDNQKLSRIDISHAAKALDKAQKTPPQGSIGILHSLGGLCKLLGRLRSSFDFTSVQPGLLNLPSGQLPIWQLRGQWKPHYLAAALPEQKERIESGKPADLSKLPDRLPDHVLLVLGQDNLFPYRIEYGRTDEKGNSKPLVTIRLSEVALNVPIDPNRFQYNPGAMEFQDKTDEYLRSLGVQPK